MSRVRRAPAYALLALLCSGCPKGTTEAPPPLESLEIASAAPGALGALAGGTEAAPTVGSLSRPAPTPDDPFGLGDEQQPAIPPPTGGDEPDAGAAPQDSGIPKHPIEEVPL